MSREIVYDLSKTIAIFSVLFYHVVQRIFNCDFFESFVNTYFLSLFFFISGLLTNHIKLCSFEYLKKQFLHVLIPFILFFFLYRIFISFLDNKELFPTESFTDSKSGYWFLFTLFSFNIILWLVNKLFKGDCLSGYKCFSLFIPFLLVAAACHFYPTVSNYLSLMSFRRYWLFFILGFLISNKYNRNMIFTNKIGVPCCILYFVCCILYVTVVKDIQSNMDFIIWFFTNAFADVTIIFVLKKIQGLLKSPLLLYIGSHTLDIYLIHYFPLAVFCSLLGGNTMNDFGDFLISILIVSGLIFISLVCSFFIRRYKITSLIFFCSFSR